MTVTTDRAPCWGWLVLASIYVAAPLQAAAGSEALVVLVRLEESVPVEWNEVAQNTARDAIAVEGRYGWLPPPEVSLEESRTALGCAAWDPACVGEIGKTLDADHVLYVEVVRPFQQLPVLSLFLVDVSAPDAAVATSVSLPDAEVNGGRVLGVYVREVIYGNVPDLVVVGDGTHAAGGVAVAATTALAGTRVVFDGEDLGPVPLVLSSAVDTGEHSLRFSSGGREVARRTLSVSAGEPFELAVSLAAEGSVEAAEEAWLNVDLESPVAWSVLGLGAAGLAAGGLLYGIYWTTARELEAAQGEFQRTGSISRMSQVEYDETEGSAEDYYVGSVVVTAVGAAVSAAGVALFFLPDDDATIFGSE